MKEKIREYPLMLECKILYAQEQELPKIPEELRTRFYPQDIDGTDPMVTETPIRCISDRSWRHIF